MSRHFEIRAQNIYFEDDGVIRCVVKPSIDLDIEDAHEVIRLLHTVGGGRARPVLIDVGPLRSINRDCRRYFAGPETAKVQAAAALLVKSPLARAMGNFFMGLNKPLFPTRLFTVEEEALTWLRKFLA